MRHNNQDDRWYQKPNFVSGIELLGYQKSRSGVEQDQRLKPVVMFFVAMPKGIRPDSNRQTNHPHIKPSIVYDVYAKKRKGGENQRQ